jgi:hypothetical protein
MNKISISTITYSKTFITKTWENHPQMLEYERRGFFQFLYVTACGHAESVICDYLKSILFFPLLEIKKTATFPQRKMQIEEIEFSISTEPEQRAVQRILERTIEDIDKASFDRIESLHKLIVGSSIREIIGTNLFGNLKGLISVRNLLAHGRELYVEMDVGGDNVFDLDTSFEKHPLENAIKSLRQAKLYDTEQSDSYDAHEPQGLIYQDEAIKHFWNTSVEVGEIYNRRADREKLITIGWTAALEKLHP